MAALMGNRQGIGDQLRAGHYAEPALVPATPWLGVDVPDTPDASGSRAQGGVLVRLTGGKTCAYFALWSRHGAEWRFAVVPAARAEWLVPDDPAFGPARAVFASAIDRLGNESALVMAPLSLAVAAAR
ncbi:hypothetical protein [Massilia glaciei]|uniref:hypothetical protein n=1 Tax=Massilia glaciei TaxID=1524097 RepID=UPI0027D810FB|nr:hypothetical protein [Massilia glaciei]